MPGAHSHTTKVTMDTNDIWVTGRLIFISSCCPCRSLRAPPRSRTHVGFSPSLPLSLSHSISFSRPFSLFLCLVISLPLSYSLSVSLCLSPFLRLVVSFVHSPRPTPPGSALFSTGFRPEPEHIIAKSSILFIIHIYAYIIICCTLLPTCSLLPTGDQNRRRVRLSYTLPAFPPRTSQLRYNYRDFFFLFYDRSGFQVHRNLVDILSRRNFFFHRESESDSDLVVGFPV